MFSPIPQRKHIQFNSTADTIRTFTYTMHNRKNRKLGIFSLILHRQHIPFSFMTSKRRTFIHTMHSGEKAKSITECQTRKAMHKA